MEQDSGWKLPTQAVASPLPLSPAVTLFGYSLGNWLPRKALQESALQPTQPKPKGNSAIYLTSVRKLAQH